VLSNFSEKEGLLLEFLLTCPNLFLCYQCLLEGFLLGLFVVKTVGYCCFPWGFLCMEKLPHNSL
jgi:hypothetical protein